MNLDLTGRTAIVTGGSSGIGRGVAIELAQAGANIVIGDLDEAPRDEGTDATTADVIRDAGGEGHFVETDVSAPQDVEALVSAADDTFGGIDILVNNAGGDQRPGTVEELTLADWEYVLSVNLTGTFLCSKYAVPHLRESDGARIINLGSTFGLFGFTNRAAYCASKAGVINLTRQLALDYADVPILANAICPGLIQTSRTRPTLENPEARERLRRSTPLPYFGTPEDIAAMAAFLASDAARFITGQCMVVDGGYAAI